MYLRGVPASVPSSASGTPSVFAVVFFQSTGVLSLFFQLPCILSLFLARKEEFFLVPAVRGTNFFARLVRFLALSTAFIIYVSIIVAWVTHMFYFWPAFSVTLSAKVTKLVATKAGSGLSPGLIYIFIYVFTFLFYLFSIPSIVSLIFFLGLFGASRIIFYARLARFTPREPNTARVS